VISLGKAKCSNSAMSTKDTVYASGRLLRTLLGSVAGASVCEPPSAGFFELDVELDDVEAAVDRWAEFLLAEPEAAAAAGGGAAAEAEAGDEAGVAEPEPEPEPE
jgi:hypothetical protein